MEERSWEGSGLDYTLTRGGRRWSLQLDVDCPGLRAADRPADQVLTLRALAAVGRTDLLALSSRSLVGVERVARRIEARYAPPGWSGLQVLASWSPTQELDGIDLEVEAMATSVGELKAVEVLVSSRLAAPEASTQEPGHIRVHPRDARSAALSYDGREPASTLGRLTTTPVPLTLEPTFSQAMASGPPVECGGRYLELAHPHDVARRIIEGQMPVASGDLSIRYGLFGYDLEKGVIVRGRLRGLWVPRDMADELSLQAFHDFLELPPPLGH
ncbi:MAG: hypothetical protein ACP5XB_03250 [Isosphaeraceae bacterium]